MTTPAAPASLFSPRYLWTTIGANALIFLGAFESLAVTTIMPTISAELDGRALYSVAFSGTLAASVIGMVVAGGWADRVGPSRPLIAAIAVFLVGLLLSGTATDMVIFIVGRILQGLGSGAINVALFVVVARIYPAALHPRIFGLFAAAWVVPSLVGPPVAGIVADAISWHWVFLGVGVLVLVAGASIIPAIIQLHAIHVEPQPTAGTGWNVVWATVVAAGIIAISIGGEQGGVLSIPIVLAAVAVVVIAIRPLLPKGTLLVRRGLPATVVLRGAVAAAFFATEVYLPYLLHDHYLLPSWLSGLILTVGAVSWAVGSNIQGRFAWSNDFTVRLGATILAAGIATQLVTAAFELSPIVAASGWLFAGGGMGLIFPRISTLVLGYSTERDQGFNSAAMTIADATGGATAIAFAGLLFSAFSASAAAGSFVATLALTTVLALLAVPVAYRIREK